MMALPENIARDQSNDRACEDQGQYFQVKPEQNWLLLFVDRTKTLKKLFFIYVSSFFLFSVLRFIH